ncbi:MAG: hypothetical protein ABIR80_19620, partial [Opitutaceae bacterium]
RGGERAQNCDGNRRASPMNAPTQQEPARMLADAFGLIGEAEANEVAGEAALKGFQTGLRAAWGEAYAALVLDDLTGRELKSDAEAARRHGISPQMVGRVRRIVRRNLGWPLRYPANANGARAREAKKKETKNNLSQ